jgi:hypothetical protein
VRRLVVLVTVLLVAVLGVGLGLSLSAPAARRASTTIMLKCSDSVGQQGQHGESVVGGVEGLVLPGSGDPAGLFPVYGNHGKRYFVYKAFLAVSHSVAPYAATVSIIKPVSAKLYYGSSNRVGELTNSRRGSGLIQASRTQVRLPVCGPKFTGYVGGIIVTAPTRVTFAVSSSHRRTERVTVAIGTA